MSEPAPVPIDLDFSHWKLPEVRAFRAATKGVLPDRAMIAIQNTFRRAEMEAVEQFGEADPPDDWMPEAIGDLDPDHLAAFSWVAVRREQPDLTFDEFCETLPYGLLQEAFWRVLFEAAESADAFPFPTPETSGPSSQPSAGPSTTSGSSSTRTSRPRSSSPKRSPKPVKRER